MGLSLRLIRTMCACNVQHMCLCILCCGLCHTCGQSAMHDVDVTKSFSKKSLWPSPLSQVKHFIWLPLDKTPPEIQSYIFDKR